MNDNYNGRINIMNETNQNAFLLSDRIPLNNPSTYYDALNGTMESTPLSNTFFSAKNIQIIQNGIRSGVYYKSNKKFLIDKQPIDQIKIIMRGVFLEHCAHKPNNISEQIQQLNHSVIQYCIPSIISEAKAYTKYKYDISTLVVPMDRPKASDYKYKTLELKHFV